MHSAREIAGRAGADRSARRLPHKEGGTAKRSRANEIFSRQAHAPAQRTRRSRRGPDYRSFRRGAAFAPRL